MTANSVRNYMSPVPNPAPLRVAVYVRISDDAEGQEAGVKRQEADCLARAEREGWNVVTVYSENDTGASTRTRKSRKQFPAMLDAARRGEFDVILAYSNSRLTRRPRELEDLIDLHKDTGVLIRTIVSGDDDLSTADGLMVARIKASVDAGESDRTGERLLRSQRENRANGGQATKAAFGWEKRVTVEGGRAVRLPDALDPVEAPALAEGLRRIRAGASVRSVAILWDSLGLTTKQGKPWTVARTREVLIRWRNAGVQIHEGQPIEEPGSWEPVCTREELEEVRALLNADRTRQAPRGRPASALLSGIAECGACGRTLLAAKGRNGEPYYRCSGAQVITKEDRCWTAIRRAPLEEAAVKALIARQFLSHPSDHQQTDETARLSTLRASLAAVEKQVAVLVDALLSGLLKPPDVGRKRAALDAEEVALKAEIDEVIARSAELSFTSDLHRSLWAPGKVRIADAVTVKRDLRERFAAMTGDDQRTLMRTVRPIVVQPGRAADRIQIGDA